MITVSAVNELWFQTDKFNLFNHCISFIIPVDEGKEKAESESDKKEENLNEESVGDKNTATTEAGENNKKEENANEPKETKKDDSAKRLVSYCLSYPAATSFPSRKLFLGFPPSATSSGKENIFNRNQREQHKDTSAALLVS